MKRWETARYMAILAHAGQTDKAGKPYTWHLRAVADQCKGDAKIVAWLHDVIEDTAVDWFDMHHMIKHFFGENDRSEEIIQALQAITKLRNESYDAYLKRIKRNPMAREVKIADLKHNLDLSRLSKITDKDLERAEKYRKALEFLESEEADNGTNE